MAVGRYFGLICLSAFSVMPISPRFFALTHGGGLCPVYAVFVDLDRPHEADSEIRMVDGISMVDLGFINHWKPPSTIIYG